LAEICLTNPAFGWRIFDVIHEFLVSLTSVPEPPLHATLSGVVRKIPLECIPKAVAYLEFFECSLWLPATKPHFVTSALVQTLVNLLGFDQVDDSVHDALSALLSLLENPINIACRDGDDKAAPDVDLNLPESQQCLIENQLWARLRDLPAAYFKSSSSRVFRTWFQWVCRAEANSIALQDVYDDLYWLRLQSGLLNGFGEQRKFCLGILRHSLLVARRSINNSLMTLEFEQRFAYQAQYDKYCTLFEVVVLNRYQNQIQACLPELTTLLGPGSLISPGWQTTLLSAALNSKVQDGTRNLLGTWYINYITNEQGSVSGYASFFITGFLPWATQGHLFTSSLFSSRQTTACTHGADLVNLLSRFIVSLPTVSQRRSFFTDVLQFILDQKGRIFQHTIIYLLEGLLQGFKETSSFEGLEISDLKILLRISRLPGQPEIATDLISTYCAEICEAAFSQSNSSVNLPGYDALKAKCNALQSHKTYAVHRQKRQPLSQEEEKDSSSLPQFLQTLKQTQHKSIQDDSFVSACANISAILDGGLERSQHGDLYDVLDALWDEAERQDFRRPVVVQVPPLFFHQTCIRLCIEQQSNFSDADDCRPLTSLITKVMQQLEVLARRRSYLASVLMVSLRTACLPNPKILSVLPFEEFLVGFVENPPIAKVEFLFEVAAAEKLQQYLPHRDYASYYGRREWYAYAASIDLLNHLPNQQLHIAGELMQRLLKPWATQKAPIPIISKWKSSLQLQTMLVLTEFCVTPSNAETYLNSFTNALMVESWPRYRYLLEWIIARIYFRDPAHAPRLLDSLAELGDTSPIAVASLMKLGVLVASFLDSEEFTLNLITQLVPFSSHHKVQIRHEAHWVIPIVWDLACEKKWESITSNPAFKALNSFVTGLERFALPASSIRTLKLDVVVDYTITDIFQGNYLAIETPEPKLFSYTDILELWAEDKEANLTLPAARVPLGQPKPDLRVPVLDSIPFVADTNKSTEITSTIFQTKSGFDLDSLIPVTGPPSIQSARPASVILVASLIDNPTNLGGLSRISESFGLEALYIHDIRQTAHKDFKATSVTSEKHLSIRELKVQDVAARIIEWKREGWTVVGVEQTDRSGILGKPPRPPPTTQTASFDIRDANVGARLKGKGKDGDGTLPRKCVLVLGSEKGGITSEVLAVLNRCVEIGTVGVTRSLNVQTAGGIAVYEWWREWGGKV
jgi:tRNA guanosine-2'-O-methyltransferase